MSQPVRHAEIRNLQKKCLLSDSQWVSNLNHHRRVRQNQAAQPVDLPIAHRAVEPAKQNQFKVQGSAFSVNLCKTAFICYAQQPTSNL
jgi:hypothetical protein